MSLEAWGDDDGAGDYDHLIDAGWWTSEDVEEVRDLVRALEAETVYENGRKEEGISVRFLARLTLLRDKVGLDGPAELVAEARRLVAETEGAS